MPKEFFNYKAGALSDKTPEELIALQEGIQVRGGGKFRREAFAQRKLVEKEIKRRKRSGVIFEGE